MLLSTTVPKTEKAELQKKKRKQTDLEMDQEMKSRGPTETAYSQGPEFDATPLCATTA